MRRSCRRRPDSVLRTRLLGPRIRTLAERDRELEREKNMAKTRGQKLEHKLQKKKEKIRQMIFDFQEKE